MHFPHEHKAPEPQVEQSSTDVDFVSAEQPVADQERDHAIELAVTEAKSDILHAQNVEAEGSSTPEAVESASEAAKQSFTELVDLTYDKSLAVALSRTNIGRSSFADSRERAKDVIQEAYMRAYKHLPKFQGNSKFETWFYRIIVNHELTHREKEQKHQHIELDATHEISDVESSSSPFEQIDTRNFVIEAMGKLRKRDREIIFLISILDMSIEQVAKLWGKKTGNVRVIHHRAKGRLREELSKESPAKPKEYPEE